MVINSRRSGVKTINYGTVQESSLGIEWSRRAGWGRREFS